MSEAIKLVECPRDAWQGLTGQIPTATKTAYLQALISAGFKHIDAVSFVSPNAIPQMADSEEVLKELDVPAEVEIIGIVVNERGAERAIATSRVETLGFPYSVSPTFLERNQKQTLEAALDELEKIQEKAISGGLDTAVYISMAFGNPYNDPWSPEEVVEAVGILETSDIKTISLADTVGLATTQQVSDLVGAVMEKYGYLDIGVHLHSRADRAAEKALAAYDAGCRRFDCAIGGLGGCPFAQDALVGNMPTEIVLEAFSQRSLPLPELKSLDTLLRASAEMGRQHSVGHKVV